MIKVRFCSSSRHPGRTLSATADVARTSHVATPDLTFTTPSRFAIRLSRKRSFPQAPARPTSRIDRPCRSSKLSPPRQPRSRRAAARSRPVRRADAAAVPRVPASGRPPKAPPPPANTQPPTRIPHSTLARSPALEPSYATRAPGGPPDAPPRDTVTGTGHPAQDPRHRAQGTGSEAQPTATRPRRTHRQTRPQLIRISPYFIADRRPISNRNQRFAQMRTRKDAVMRKRTAHLFQDVAAPHPACSEAGPETRHDPAFGHRATPAYGGSG